MTAVRVDLLHDMADMHTAADLLRDVWGGTEHPVQPALLMAQAHAGNYVSAAWVDDRMVGASMAFLADPDALALHSHITGVAADAAGRGVGHALKDHQAAWCRDRGITRVHWTFDPLVARNAWFNLARLGAVVDAYLVDFYGDMPDERNAGQGSDRLLVTWHVDTPGDDVGSHPGRPGPGRPGPGLPGVRTESGPLVVAVGPDDRPVVSDPDTGATSLQVAVPRDVEALRRTDPDRAIAWRHAVRAELADRVGSADRPGDWRVTGFTRDRTYVLTTR